LKKAIDPDPCGESSERKKKKGLSMIWTKQSYRSCMLV